MLNQTQQKKLLTLMPELKEQLAQLALLMQADPQQPLMVAACGLYNAGKSSLLNALSGHVHEEYFKTANVRETYELKTLALPGMTLLDTPGLDASSQDDQVAFEGILKSDLILLVHNPRNGELDQMELDYLARINAQSSQPVEQRILLVLTYGAEISAQDKKLLLQRIETQFKQRFGAMPAHFWVDSPTFIKGIKENKKALAKAGGVEPIHVYLSNNHQRLAQSQAKNLHSKQQQAKRQLRELLQQVIRYRENSLAQQVQLLQQQVQHQEQQAHKLQTSLAAELQ